MSRLNGVCIGVVIGNFAADLAIFLIQGSLPVFNWIVSACVVGVIACIYAVKAIWRR